MVTLPVALNCPEPGREFDLGDRQDRARLYEVVLREGFDQDIETYIDGALLVQLWDQLVLPRDLRRSSGPLIDSVVEPE